MTDERMEIVPVAQRLIDSFHACLDVVAKERRYLEMVEAPPLEDVRSFVQATIDASRPQVFLVEGDERVVGWADVFGSTREGLRHAGVLGMGLLPEFRGRGWGGRLLEEIVKVATAASITRIELQVWDDNLPAIKLYERFGFELEGTRRRARVLDGVSQDSLVMARLAG
jgi:RimJ/RimL family protein N-acetyltransferase